MWEINDADDTGISCNHLGANDGSQGLDVYNLEQDSGDEHNLASEQPETVQLLLEFSKSNDASRSKCGLR